MVRGKCRSTQHLCLALSGALSTVVACRPLITNVERPPASSEAKAWLLAQLGNPTTLWAQDLDDDTPILLVLEDDVPIEAHAFDRPLAVLGLEPGRQRIVDAAEPRARRLPAAGAVWRLDVDTATWDRQAAASASIAGLSVEGRPGCRRWRVRTERMPPVGSLRWALPFDGKRALVGAVGGIVLWASPERSPAFAAAVPAGLLAATRSAPDTIITAGHDGQIDVLRASADGSFERIDLRLPVRESVIRVAGSADDGWALTSSGSVWQRREGTWSERLRRPSARAEPIVEGGLAKLPADASVLVGMGSEDQLVQVSPDAVRNLQVFGEAAGTVAIQKLDDDGIIVGGFGGVLAYSRDGGAWQSLGRTPSGFNTYAFSGTGEAFLYGTLYGTVGEYRSGEGYCPETRIDGERRGAVIGLVQIGDAVLVVDDSAGPTWAWLEPDGANAP